jgi:hexosaminidase
VKMPPRRAASATGLRLLGGVLAALALAVGSPLAGASPGPERSGQSDEHAEGGSDNRPLTIPALRHWAPRPGEFVLGEATRIVIKPGKGSKKLADAADLLADEIGELTGAEPRVVSSASRAGSNEIRLALGPPDPELGKEGYELEVGEEVRVRAPTPTGVFYGTRTILQLLHQDRAIPAGVARDWPRYSERGLFLPDNRLFATRWIKAHIRELAYLKMNYLVLPIGGDGEWHVESIRHPEVVSDQHLPKAQVRELIEFAERHQITVVGGINMPGHMGAALRPHPEHQLANALGQRNPKRLDITDQAARAYARELVDEYLDLFPGPYWYIGADEFMPAAEYPLHPQLEGHAREQYGSDANAKDAVHGFINWVDELVRAHGKTSRVWHDGLGGGSAVTVNPEIVVEWWTNFSPLSDPNPSARVPLLRPPTPQELLDRGHRIQNAGWFPTYYVVGALGTHRPDMRTAYESWHVHEFHGPLVWDENVQYGPVTVDPDEPRNLGSKLHVFTDDPEGETEDEIAAGIAPRLRVLAQKTWESPLLTESYAEFRPITEKVGHAPGYER